MIDDGSGRGCQVPDDVAARRLDLVLAVDAVSERGRSSKRRLYILDGGGISIGQGRNQIELKIVSLVPLFDQLLKNLDGVGAVPASSFGNA